MLLWDQVYCFFCCSTNSSSLQQARRFIIVCIGFVEESICVSESVGKLNVPYLLESCMYFNIS